MVSFRTCISEVSKVRSLVKCRGCVKKEEKCDERRLVWHEGVEGELPNLDWDRGSAPL